VIHDVADHLWQSTVFAALAALAALALRNDAARLRHWIWLAASLKIAVPFALIVRLGAALAGVAARPAFPSDWAAAIEPIATPFAVAGGAGTAHLAAVASSADLPPAVAAIVWACGALLVAAPRWIRALRVAAVVARAAPLPIEFPVPVRALSAPFAPAVFGVLRPVLLLPQDIERRLSPRELSAVLEHEHAHVRRLDNFTAALHGFVEAAFWFHPLVWWIGAKLLATREQACDEAVVAAGRDRLAYAETILKVCRHYAAAPAPASAAGGDLKRRIAWIMTPAGEHRFRRSRRAVVFGWLAAALAAPFALGLGHAQPRAAAAPTPVFDTLTIRRASGTRELRVLDLPGRPQGNFSGRASLKELIGWARYGPAGDQIVGGPAWLDSYGFDITMMLAPGGGDGPSALRYVLEQRFALRVHIENDPVYVLESLPAGSRLREVPRKPDTVTELNETPGRIAFRGTSLTAVAAALGRALGRPVLDHSGLRGLYDGALEWRIARPLSADAALDKQSAQEGEAEVLAKALREQLGVELTSFSRETLVIDRAELPVED